MNNVKKLTRREFARALKLGHGRAVLHVLRYGDKGVEDQIERALIKNYVYDEQIEGSRRCYLKTLIRNTGNVSAYAMRVLKSFDYEQTNERDCSQQIYICSFFFEHGFSEFRPMMFRKFHALISFKQPSLYCGKELIDVAGLSGLEFVAHAMGSIESVVDDYDCANILEHAEFVLNGHTVTERIKELSHTNSAIKAFMEAAARHKEDKPSHTRTEQPVQTAEEFLETVRAAETGKYHLASFRFRRSASDADIRKVFNYLLSASTEAEQAALLKVFEHRRFPKFDPRIFDFLSSSVFRVRYCAADAIGMLKHSAVRREALEWLSSENNERILIGMQMLKKNYRQVDHEILLSALKRLKKPDDIHSAGMNLKSIAREEGGKELAPCFIWLYEYGPDTFCREGFLKLLLEWGECPEQILFESQWDAGDDVQMLARSHLNSLELIR